MYRVYTASCASHNKITIATPPKARQRQDLVFVHKYLSLGIILHNLLISLLQRIRLAIVITNFTNFYCKSMFCMSNFYNIYNECIVTFDLNSENWAKAVVGGTNAIVTKVPKKGHHLVLLLINVLFPFPFICVQVCYSIKIPIGMISF